MISKSLLSLTMLMAVQLWGCSHKTAGKLNEARADEAFSGNRTGTYTGVIPCADCPGIETKVTLKPDYSYDLTTLYQDRQDTPEHKTGKFLWDESRNVIELKNNTGKKKLFQFSDNGLTMLDQNGEKISGALADHYVLKKEGARNIIIKGLASGKWIVQSLENSPKDALSTDKTPYIQFDPDENRIYGHSGCNRFFGTYQLGPKGKINLSGIGATQMFCAKTMEIEHAFLNMLEKCKYISKSDSILQLKNEKQEIIASFSKE